jgi:hypothetical protein
LIALVKSLWLASSIPRSQLIQDDGLDSERNAK